MWLGKLGNRLCGTLVALVRSAQYLALRASATVEELSQDSSDCTRGSSNTSSPTAAVIAGSAQDLRQRAHRSQQLARGDLQEDERLPNTIGIVPKIAMADFA